LWRRLVAHTHVALDLGWRVESAEVALLILVEEVATPTLLWI